MITWLTSTTFGRLIATFLISVAPTVELRGGLPYGIALGPDYPVALAAVVLDMRLKAIPAIFLGVCIAASIMTMVTFGLIHIL